MVQSLYKVGDTETHVTCHLDATREVRFSLGEKQILETRCIKQHACLVDPLGVTSDFLHSPTFDVFHLKKKRLKPRRKGIEIKVPRRSRVEISSPRTSNSGPFRPKRRGQKEGHTEF